MNYIIFDLEWNQPSAPTDKSAALRHGEIVQIGFFVLDETLNTLAKDEITVKPVVYPTMNQYVSILTGITQEQAESGLPFPAALEKMAEYFNGETVLFTWGDDDLPILKENMAYHGITLPLPPHYNLQRIFCAQTQTPAVQIGLKTAAEHFGINTNVQTHDALNDSYITLLIARQLRLPEGIEQYHRKNRAPEKEPPWLSEAPILTEETDYLGSIDGMAAFCADLFTACPICGKKVKIRKFCRFHENAFISKLRCSDDGEFFTLFEKNGTLLKSRIYPMTDSLSRFYQARLQRKKNNERYWKLRREMNHSENNQ